MNRDWALRRAEELVKSHPAALGKTVNMERGSNTHERGIYVDGVRVFEQGSRFSKMESFFMSFRFSVCANGPGVAQLRLQRMASLWCSRLNCRQEPVI